MAANTRTEDQIRQDRARAAELYKEGWTQSRIAQEIGVSQAQISYDLAAIRKEWRESALRDFDAAKMRELEKIDLIESEAWEAYHRSKEERQKAVKEKVEGDTSGRTKVQVTTEKVDGDPRFLSQIMACIDRRCKILGINAPERHELTGKDGGPVQTESSVKIYLPDNRRDEGSGDGGDEGD